MKYLEELYSLLVFITWFQFDVQLLNEFCHLLLLEVHDRIKYLKINCKPLQDNQVKYSYIYLSLSLSLSLSLPLTLQIGSSINWQNPLTLPALSVLLHFLSLES